MTRATIRRALRLCGPFKAVSRADGTILVTAAWSDWGKRCVGAEKLDDGACQRCGGLHIGGIFDRMGLAEAIEALLNRERAGKP